MKVGLIIVRIVLGSIFLFSGTIKIFDVISFRETLSQVFGFDGQLLNLLSVMIPALEFVVGITILFNILKGISKVLSTTLVVGFIATSLWMLNTGLEISCGCFGSFDVFYSNPLNTLIFDIFLAGLILFLFSGQTNKADISKELSVFTIITLSLSMILQTQISNYDLLISINSNKINRIHYQRAITMVNEDNALLLDVREKEQYTKFHLEKAISMPKEELDTHLYKLDNISKARNIVIYCSSSRCGDSDIVALKLVKEGFHNISIIKNGIDFWTN